jgi:hypothetical protein
LSGSFRLVETERTAEKRKMFGRDMFAIGHPTSARLAMLVNFGKQIKPRLQSFGQGKYDLL